MKTLSLVCPDIGLESATVIDILVSVGDCIALNDPVITVESDKASMDIPADVAGLVAAIDVTNGDSISKGVVILTVTPADADETTATETTESEGTASQNLAAVGNANEAVAAPSTSESPAMVTVPADVTQSMSPKTATVSTAIAQLSDVSSQDMLYAGPAVRRLARKLGVALSAVQATGLRNRITQEDVFSYARHHLTDGSNQQPAITTHAPSVQFEDFAPFGALEVRPMSRITELTAQQMHIAHTIVPQVTQFDSADITDLEAFRQSLKQEAASRQIKLTLLAFVMKACAFALREFENLNSSVDVPTKKIFYKQYYHIGFAVDTSKGLFVPVVRDVVQQSIWGIAQQIDDLANAARQGTLHPSQMQGGCFTISNLGSISGAHFTPIVNTPQVAILGISQAKQQPLFAQDGTVRSALMMPLSLSYDHRIINGAEGIRATNFIAQLLSDVRRLTLL